MPDPSSQVRARVAILNAHWLVHSSVWYIAACLEKEGYEVDIYIYDGDISSSADLLKNSERIKIHRYDVDTIDETGLNYRDASGGKKKLWHLVRAVVPASLRRFVLKILLSLSARIYPRSGLVPGHVIGESVAAALAKPYSALIGVEKGGLYWAGEIAREAPTPIAYYSLELFTNNNSRWKSNLLLRRLKPFEEQYHRKCALTIVQDLIRGKILLLDNGVGEQTKIACLPVSISGEATSAKSDWLQRELDLPPQTTLILYYGVIEADRFSDKLVGIAQSFPGEWRLVLHGYGNPGTVDEFMRADKLARVRTSLRIVPTFELEEVVRSAHVGVAFYRDTTENERLTGFSSEKIAMYFKCGIPLVAFRYPSYEHIEQEHAGVLIDRLEELPAAITKILSDYPAYVEGALSCYRNHYCFDTNIPAVIAGLQAIQRN